MITMLNVVSFSIFVGILIVGTTLKIYTARKLSDINGMGPIILQDGETKQVIAELGD